MLFYRPALTSIFRLFPKRENDGRFLKNKVLVGHTYIDTGNATPQQMAFYYKQVRLNKLVNEHYYFNWLGKQNIGLRFQPGSNIYEGTKQYNNGHDHTSVLVDGTTPVEIIVQNIDSEEKAAHYLYRVIKNNNQELVGWQLATNLKTTADGSVRYAYLGKFNYTPGEFLKVEIYNLKNFNDQDAVLIDWRKVEPAKAYGYIRYTIPTLGKQYILFQKYLTQLKIERYQKYSTDLKIKSNGRGRQVDEKSIIDTIPYNDFIQTTNRNDVRFRLGDSLQNMVFDIGNGNRTYDYMVSLKRNIDGKTDSVQLGETNDKIEVYKALWDKPGKYSMVFTPKIYKPGGTPITMLRNKATTISFTVLPALNVERKVSEKTLAYIILIILTTAGFMFFMYRDSQKRKLAKAAQNRQIATLQLQSVRAQLNPHFIFNALAGIQNLMNKNEVENANKYLSKFARLTRNVLDEGNKELTSIEQETDLINDYLLMEQMRFGFKFEILVDGQEIDKQIEVPAMLLQPFVENAVKHGVSALKSDGMITVTIAKAGSTLVLAVKDNGKGFIGSTTNGMGMKLCEERIKLLNSIYKNTNITMSKTTGNNGTLITIELKNWL